MDPARASLTALAAAMVRAIHTRVDKPALLDDTWGDRLVTDEERAALVEFGLRSVTAEDRERLEALDSTDEVLSAIGHAHPSYAVIIIRARYAEDALAAAVAEGAEQYVIVGAGMDSFALRRPEFARDLQILEVDHPATQELKLGRLETRPAGVEYVTADLGAETLEAALGRSSFDPSRRTFFAWLGVTPYLTREENLQTFRAIATLGAPGSEVVFDYLEQGYLDRSDEEAVRIRESFESVAEPWVSGFDPAELKSMLSGVGLDLVEDLDAEEQVARYSAGLEPASGGHLVLARAAARP